MLKSLYVSNFALIDEISIDFDEGFNVFTGETGAGKSIIIEAISFLLRGKADLSVVKTNADKAIIEGVFHLGENDEEMRRMLKEEDIDFEDDTIIVKRVIGKNRNSIKINQASVTLGFLSDLFANHVDIHSQRDSQYLFNHKNHLPLLDRYISDKEAFAVYDKAYRKYEIALRELKDFENSGHSESEIDFLSFQLNEIRNANLSIEEEEELENSEKIYKSSEKYLSALNQSNELYAGNGGIKEKLYETMRILDIDEPSLKKAFEAIEAAYYSLDEAMEDVNSFFDRISQNEIDIEEVEQRLFTYNKLKRKYGKDVEGINEYAKSIEKTINEYSDYETTLLLKRNNVEVAKKEAMMAGDALRAKRKSEALKLEKSIIEETKDLVLPNVSFKTVFKEKELSNDGIDDVEFHVSMNKGERLKPLKDVASGGEMSRLMLALKAIFCALNKTSLIIFDEIDSGVSGKVALAVGKKMAAIGQKLQVLSITHSAPVAACASSHFYIYKNDASGRSNTSIKKLNEDEIIAELASISSSSNKEGALLAAKELYQSAQESLYHA